jgi:hypothetical protein
LHPLSMGADRAIKKEVKELKKSKTREKHR